MHIAVIGPVVKDEVIIDDKVHSQPGGIPFYIGNTLKALGVKVTVVVSCAKEDEKWAKSSFPDMEVVHVPADGTLKFICKYASRNPDMRDHTSTFVTNSINPEHVENKLETADYIIFGPLFHGNTTKELFEHLSHKTLFLGNFGMFTYSEGQKMVKKHPEKLIEVLEHLDYLFLDEEEIKFVSGKNSVQDAVKSLQKHIKNIVVTKGSNGSTIFIEEQEFNIPAFPPKQLTDPTGSGDCYMAGFIRATELFDEPLKWGEFAAMVATISIEKKGPFSASLEDVYNRLGWTKL